MGIDASRGRSEVDAHIGSLNAYVMPNSKACATVSAALFRSAQLYTMSCVPVFTLFDPKHSSRDLSSLCPRNFTFVPDCPLNYSFL